MYPGRFLLLLTRQQNARHPVGILLRIGRRMSGQCYRSLRLRQAILGLLINAARKFRYFLAALIVGLLFIYSIACAGETSRGLDKKNESILSGNRGRFYLEVAQTPLEQVLEIIEKQTNIQLHVSRTPAKLVTATCVGTTLEVLKCVLGRNVNLIYQYADKSFAGNADPNGLLTDIWVLNGAPDEHRLSITENLNENIQDRQYVAIKEEAGRLFALARAKNPAKRQEALTRIAHADQIEDAMAIAILKEAFQDKNARVRAQAVAALARRQAPAIDSILRQALRDRNVGVRLMAVSNAGENVALLKMALNDPNEAVRRLAGIKLDHIAKTNSAMNR